MAATRRCPYFILFWLISPTIATPLAQPQQGSELALDSNVPAGYLPPPNLFASLFPDPVMEDVRPKPLSSDELRESIALAPPSQEAPSTGSTVTCDASTFRACCKDGFTGCATTIGLNCPSGYGLSPKCCQLIIVDQDNLCCTSVQGRQCCAKYRTEDSCCEDYINGVCCKSLSKDGVCCVELDDEGSCCARMENGRCCMNAQGTCQPSRWQQKLDGQSYTPFNLIVLPQNF